MSRAYAIERDEDGKAARLVWMGDSAPAKRRGASECGFCGASLTGSNPGSPRKFCSPDHRRAQWDKDHPRLGTQKPLDFAPASDPGRLARTAPVEGEPFEASRIWLLGRLQRGPVSTLELRSAPWPASMNPAQRVYELRQRQHDIRTEREGKDFRYALYVDGMRVER